MSFHNVILSTRHTDEMIDKLESAGLGFYVKATETQQKLGRWSLHYLYITLYTKLHHYIIHLSGKIPLRQLVYRVLDLPPSMRPLVYDFGRLSVDTEKDYTKQIVTDHVS